MIRCALIAVLAAACGSSPPPSKPAPSEPIETFSPKGDVADPARCDAGNWVPNAQEPAHYVACTANTECVKMALDGCCSTTYVAIRRDRICGTDLGSSCEMECLDHIRIYPAGSESKHAACVANKCTLVH